MIIFGGTGDSWIAGVDPDSLATMNAVPDLPAGQAYQTLYADGLAMIRDLVLSVEVPTIGVINGPGPRKETDTDVRHHLVRRPCDDLGRQLRHRPRATW
ncbi:hypothetical protein OG474_22460 [Kribbella sp. NBC_01505]|uniref:hypothetical protein n=1 Tax=Kribbella sp. NBC_01505 TaxID=2903580 RepID=UPI00386C4410